MDARTAPAAVRRLLDLWYRAECAIAVGALAFMAGVLVLDVAGRELLGPLLKALHLGPAAMGIFGAPKLAVYSLAIATYAGLGIAAARGTHIVPRVGFAAVPMAWGPAVDRLADMLTAAFLLGVAGLGIQLVRESAALGLRAPVLNWPVAAVQIALPLGFASAALRYAAFAAWPMLRPSDRGKTPGST